MGYQELMAALRREGEEKAGELRRRGEAEAEQLRVAGRERIAELHRTYAALQVREAEAESRLILSEAEAAERRLRLAAQSELGERLWQLARTLLPRLRTADYPRLFVRLAAELPPLAWETVLVHPEDQHLAMEAFPGATVTAAPDISGGMEVAGLEGRMRVDNTFGKRLERGWGELLPEILEGVHGAIAARNTP